MVCRLCYFSVRSLRGNNVRTQRQVCIGGGKQINHGTSPLRGNMATGRLCLYVDLIIITKHFVVTKRLFHFVQQSM
jgi:hypothetical protein